nr:MAG TPA: hypothetical protein [Caudoviricetes sp.]
MPRAALVLRAVPVPAAVRLRARAREPRTPRGMKKVPVRPAGRSRGPTS